MNERYLAQEARENLALTHEALEAMRASVIAAFEATSAQDDVGRLTAWAQLGAITELRRRLNGPLHNLAIQEASQKGSTSHD